MKPVRIPAQLISRKNAYPYHHISSLITVIFVSISLLVLNLFSQNPADLKGNIVGVVVDEETGEPLIGANIYLENTYLGAATDVDGAYVIADIPVGRYNLIVQMLSYAEMKVKDVEVKANQSTRIDLVLKPEALMTETIVVEARAVNNTEAALLKSRQRAVAVSDAISAQEISRAGSDNAANAMIKVTGASVVDGKYVYIRGLGDRYSSTSLNGAQIPSADPERKAVNMDLFPSNLLDNIVTLKTFTPDKPGNFSGGMVDISTKSYPDVFTFKFAASVSHNSLATFNSNYLTYPGGSLDWLGMDDGTRDVPQYVKEHPDFPFLSPETRRDPALANELDQASKSFSPYMAPIQKSAPLDRSLSLAIGNQTKFLGRPIGYLLSLSYKRNYSFYENGKIGRWSFPEEVITDSTALIKELYLSDSRGEDLVTWGTIATLASKFHPNHELTGNFYYTQSGYSAARYLQGSWFRQLGSEIPVYETRSLVYIERNLQSYQLQGEHFLEGLGRSKINWQTAYSITSQNEPDMRFFTNIKDTTVSPVNYSVLSSGWEPPSRYFRYLEEDGLNLSLDFSLPFRQFGGHLGQLKIGGLYSGKDRTFEESLYAYGINPQIRPVYNGDALEFFGPKNTGIIRVDSSAFYPYQFGNYIYLALDRGTGNGDYTGRENVSAGYAMVEFPVSREFRVITGVRYEITDMYVESADTNLVDTLRIGSLKEKDWLPSVNLVYQIGNNMNIRAAYGRTLARPTLRELAPYESFEFAGDYSFVGNVNLKRVLINNYDLRWEWFLQPGEIVAVSGFYKKLENPMEKSIGGNADFPQIFYENVEKGIVYGIEFEVRKDLALFSSYLRNFKSGINLTLAQSKIDLPAGRRYFVEKYDPNKLVYKTFSRPLQGQSPFIFNLHLSYENFKSGTFASLYFNVFGQRLAEVGIGANPDVYEHSRRTLDFILRQRLWKSLNFQFEIKNIFNDPVKYSHRLVKSEFVRREYNTGMISKIGFNFEL